MVLREDDRLADLLAVIHRQTVGHQNMQHLTDRIGVEDPLIQRARADTVGHFAVLIGKGALIFRLILIGQLVIHDTLLDEFQPCFDRHEVDQKAVLDRLTQLVGIGRLVIVQIKHLIGVFLDLIFRGRGESHQRRVEVVEDIFILVVDGAVRLVADQEIEVTAGEELALVVFYLVNTAHHRLIGRENAVRRIVVLFLTEICHAQVGQEIDKTALCLCHERGAVGEEQDVLYPAVL